MYVQREYYNLICLCVCVCLYYPSLLFYIYIYNESAKSETIQVEQGKRQKEACDRDHKRGKDRM